MLYRLTLTAWMLGGLSAVASFGAPPDQVGRSPATPTARADAPRPVAIWPTGPLEVRVAFDRPIAPALARALTGQTIPFGDPADPKGEAGGTRLAATLGRLRIAAARLEDEGRTLVLATDPHPRQATYLLTLPAVRDAGQPAMPGEVSLAYDLTGVEVRWEAGREGADPAWSGWSPELDPAAARALAGGSVEHERVVARLDRPGQLSFLTLVTLPKGKVAVRLESDAPIKASLAFEDAASGVGPRGRHRAEWHLESTGEAVELAATIPTGARDRPTTLHASYHTEGDPTERPLPRARLVLPWTPPPTPTSAPAPPPGLTLAGGDPRRGEAVFLSDEAKCSTCHKVRGRGGDVGPALDGLVGRDPAEVYRDIAEPSAVIHPEYVPYTVAMKDGRVAVGVVRAEGADAIRVLDTNGQPTILPRAEVEELRPSGTSVMPVGLAGALGEAGMRDLVAFLLTPPPGSQQGGSNGAPAEVAAAPGQANPAPHPADSPARPLPRLATEVAFPNLRFDRPVALAYPDDGSHRLFVVEQRGLIWSFSNDPGTADRREFLDLRSRVLSPASGGHNEEGLLGLAFHPAYKRNGELFVYYSAKEGPTQRRSVVSRFKVSGDDPGRADPASEQRIWVGPPDPYGNHNGGTIAFGPDNNLYITLGDSGAADDPLTTGQDPRDWFGSILRIDVDHPGDGKPYGIPKDNPRLRDPGRFADWAPEVYCIGLRNVWKFSFDRRNGTLWAGDVGQNLWEMVHIIENGGNYGWSLKEAFHPFRPRQRKDPASPLSPPLAEYPHTPNQAGSGRMDDGKSITGGYVYRGRALPGLVGVYVYGDYDSGRIWGLRAEGAKAVANGELIDRGGGPRMNVASFGEDPEGELYILAFDGRINRLVARP